MKRRRAHDPWEAFQAVTEAAERFVNHSPRSKRLETDRQVLLDAIRQAQLLLSLKRLPARAEEREEGRKSPTSQGEDHTSTKRQRRGGDLIKARPS